MVDKVVKVDSGSDCGSGAGGVEVGSMSCPIFSSATTACGKSSLGAAGSTTTGRGATATGVVSIEDVVISADVADGIGTELLDAVSVEAVSVGRSAMSVPG